MQIDKRKYKYRIYNNIIILTDNQNNIEIYENITMLDIIKKFRVQFCDLNNGDCLILNIDNELK